MHREASKIDKHEEQLLDDVKPETSSVTFQDQLASGGNLEKSKSDSKLNQVSS